VPGPLGFAVATESFDPVAYKPRRLGQLAALGLTNRQLAEALFVTVKTVETHLARAYQKLGTGPGLS
jgi:DNA-binding NarL/FixJ family response regulator